MRPDLIRVLSTRATVSTSSPDSRIAWASQQLLGLADSAWMLPA